MRAYVNNIMVILIIFPVILQTVINVIMLSIGGQTIKRWHHKNDVSIKNKFHVCSESNAQQNVYFGFFHL